MLLGCQSPSEPPAPPAASAASQATAWDAFRDSFLEDYFELNPSDAVDQGRHEFDGQIGDWSPASFSLQIEFLKAAAAEAEAFDEAT